jgi:hypothetical protein
VRSVRFPPVLRFFTVVPRGWIAFFHSSRVVRDFCRLFETYGQSSAIFGVVFRLRRPARAVWPILEIARRSTAFFSDKPVPRAVFLNNLPEAGLRPVAYREKKNDVKGFALR